MNQSNKSEEKKLVSSFLQNTKPEQIKTLDVRPTLESGKDPLQLIMQHIKLLQDDETLKIINTFEPVPLIGLLKKQGYEYCTEFKDDGIVETYFHKANQSTISAEENKIPENNSTDWDELTNEFDGKFEYIDVSSLTMPEPMMKILAALEILPANRALYIHHKRIPVFLLDELKDRQFDYRIKTLSENEVHLMIFKKK